MTRNPNRDNKKSVIKKFINKNASRVKNKDLVSATCPQCGAMLEIEDSINTFYCKYCGSRVILQNQNKDAVKAKAYIKKLDHQEKMADKIIDYLNERAERKSQKKERQRKHTKQVLIGCAIVYVILMAIIFGMGKLEKKEKANLEDTNKETIGTTSQPQQQETISNSSTQIGEVLFTKRIDEYTKGETINFGKYPKDYNVDKYEDIEWEIVDVDVENNRILLRSAMIIDAQQYNEEEIAVSWEDSDLRKWLNGDFYMRAFSEQEQQLIATVPVKYGESELLEKVTIPSYAEAYGKNGMRAQATRYAFKQGLTLCRKVKIDHPVRTQTNYYTYGKEGRKGRYEYYDNYGKYWVRSSTNDITSVWYISGWGDLMVESEAIYYTFKGGVRPQMWVTVF